MTIRLERMSDYRGSLYVLSLEHDSYGKLLWRERGERGERVHGTPTGAVSGHKHVQWNLFNPTPL